MTSARENTHKRDKGNALWTLKRPKLVLSAFYATDFSQTLQGFRIKKKKSKTKTRKGLATCPNFTCLPFCCEGHTASCSVWRQRLPNIETLLAKMQTAFFTPQTVCHHRKSLLEEPPALESMKRPHTRSIQRKIDPFKCISQNFLWTILISWISHSTCITSDGLKWAAFCRSTQYQRGRLKQHKLILTKTKALNHSFLVSKPNAPQKAALPYKHKDRSHFPLLLIQKCHAAF